MKLPRYRRSWLALLSLVLLSAPAAPLVAAGHRFEVTVDAGVSSPNHAGRLYVFLSQRAQREPRFGPDWFSPEPFFGIDVVDFGPGTTRVVDDSADSFPAKLSALPAGKYRIQALFDQDLDSQNHAQGVGNLYSRVGDLTLDPAQPETVALKLDQVIAERPFDETEWRRLIKLRSPLLSAFHHREVLVPAAVVLPASYHAQPERRYPVMYCIPGFGGSERDALAYREPPAPGEGEIDFIRVMLSGSNKWGHHVFADSATCGPRGTALVAEMIPHIDATYRTIAAPTARFVTGHSSGGWSSLWLQINWPQTFGGVWSLSPDPVDFRDYQQVNLYANPPLSLYFDQAGARRPIARRGREPALWYESFGRMDDAIGRGGQLRSFEAVFSPLDSHGAPQRLWDRTTGRIDPAVAKAWEAYDVRLKLERNWPTLGEKLQGKLHITTGELDSFYLEGAVVKLSETLKKLGSDAEIAVLPGADHGGTFKPEVLHHVRTQMSASVLRHHPTAGR